MMTSQFGSGNKNPPWARQATEFMTASGMAGQSQVSSGLVQQPGLANNPAVYSYNSTAALQQQQQQQQYAAQQQLTLQNQAAAMSQPGMAMPTTLGGSAAQVATVSYPSARANQAASTAAANQKQRVFTGTVTKLHENFGFIDEDVFFQTNCVKGVVPKVGDRVFVEASYNPAMPFKWNATRVQVLSNSQSTSMGSSAAAAVINQQQQLNVMQQAAKTIGLGAMGAAPGNAAGLLGGVNPLQLAATVSAINSASNLMGSLANRSGLGAQGGRGRGMMRGSGVSRSGFSGESRFSEDRDRGRDRDRDRDRREKRDSRRRSRSSSPASRTRSPKRSRVVRPPPRYVVQAPRFVLTLKEASVMTLRSKYANMYIPSDFFNGHSHWVDNLPLHRPFGLGQTCKFHVMHKDVNPLTPETAVLDPPDADHKYCAKVMLLTCPSLEDMHSKSCGLAQESPEAQDSFQHPTRLLQFLVGTRGKNEPMAIGGPWSPSLDGADPEENPQVLIKTAIRTTKALTGIDLSKCTQWYRFAEIRYLRAETSNKPARVETVVLFLPDVWRCAPTRLDWMNLQKAYMLKLQKKLNPDAEEPEEPQAEGEPKKEPTHFSLLDPKTLKLQELRDELDSRSLSSKGLKSQLIARLTKALLLEEEADSVAKAQKEKEDEEKKAQEEEEEKEKEKKDAAQKKEEEEQERKRKKERQQLEKRYTLPDAPAIVVHPNTVAKSGKFDCSVMTLSVLLDYRAEDNKEHSFEVSLFAELFNEMLMRDFGFTIYKALVAAPAKVEEEKKKKDSKDSKEKDSKDKDKKSEGKTEEPPSKKKKSDDQKKDEEDGDGDQDMEDEDEKDGHSCPEDDDKDKDKKDSKRDKKKFEMVTVDPALLLACVYFDQNHCGYLQDRDLEDIIFSLGLDLSRAQVRKLVQKVVTRDSFHYRKLCDQPMSKEGDAAPEQSATQLISLEVLAKGNFDYLTPFRQQNGTAASPKGSKGKEAEFVTFRGSVVDLESLMEKLEGSDSSRTLLENKLADMATQLESAKASLSSQETAVKSIKQELTSTQARLQNEMTQRSTMESQRLQWEAAVSEAKVALHQAATALGVISPEKTKEEKVKEESMEESEKEKGSKGKDKETVKKEKA